MQIASCTVLSKYYLLLHYFFINVLSFSTSNETYYVITFFDLSKKATKIYSESGSFVRITIGRATYIEGLAIDFQPLLMTFDIDKNLRNWNETLSDSRLTTYRTVFQVIRKNVPFSDLKYRTKILLFYILDTLEHSVVDYKLKTTFHDRIETEFKIYPDIIPVDSERLAFYYTIVRNEQFFINLDVFQPIITTEHMRGKSCAFYYDGVDPMNRTMLLTKLARVKFTIMPFSTTLETHYIKKNTRNLFGGLCLNPCVLNSTQLNPCEADARYPSTYLTKTENFESGCFNSILQAIHHHLRRGVYDIHNQELFDEVEYLEFVDKSKTSSVLTVTNESIADFLGRYERSCSLSYVKEVNAFECYEKIILRMLIALSGTAFPTKIIEKYPSELKTFELEKWYEGFALYEISIRLSKFALDQYINVTTNKELPPETPLNYVRLFLAVLAVCLGSLALAINARQKIIQRIRKKQKKQ